MIELRELRQVGGFSASALGRIVGVTGRTIERWEINDRAPQRVLPVYRALLALLVAHCPGRPWIAWYHLHGDGTPMPPELTKVLKQRKKR